MMTFHLIKIKIKKVGHYKSLEIRVYHSNILTYKTYSQNVYFF